MERVTRLARHSVEPGFGLLYAIAWTVGSVGREPTAWIPFFLIGIAIGTARRLPVAALAATLILVVLQLLLEDLRFTQSSWPALLGLLVAAIFVGSSPYRPGRFLALPISAALGLGIGLLLTVPALGRAGRIGTLSGWPAGHPGIWPNIVGWCVAIVAIAPAFWFVGYGLRARRERAASENLRIAAEADLAGAELELRVSSERDRIAQDVHDIMAHSLSVIIAQADGARYLSDIRPATTKESLSAIAQSARESLVEVRMLIDSLGPESDGHSHPTLDGLGALFERMESAGLVVASTTFGEAGELTAGQQLAVYRIVQESLTNALKHGGKAAEAQVVFDWRGPGLALTVSSTGEGAAAPIGSMTRGLRGMRERARLAGGWLAAGPDEEHVGRFIVTAFIPRADAMFSATELA
jgi:signal transduction histidine kinase